MMRSSQAQAMPVLHIVTGPTAVGKTELTLRWAEANNAEILSCDSLLFYQGMDIGTAKPTKEERSRVAHHGIDLVPPSEAFNVARYIEVAKHAIEDIASRGKSILITGGSGFYLKAFFAPVVDPLVIPQEIEMEVDKLYDCEGLNGVVSRLRQVSPEDTDRVDLCNPRRVIPALKRCLASGCSISELQARLREAPLPFANLPKTGVLLQRDRSIIRKRITERTRAMLQAGLIDEVTRLREMGFEQNPSACGSIGYREVIDMQNGSLTEETLESTISLHTDQLVSKQLKWFRTQLPKLHPLNLDHPGLIEDPLVALTEAFAIHLVE